jgi:hypothetical protein
LIVAIVSQVDVFPARHVLLYDVSQIGTCVHFRT